MQQIGKLHGGFAILFAVVAIGAAIGLFHLTANMDQKIANALFFGTFGIAGFLSTFVTQAKTLVAALVFAAAAAATAAFYYVLIADIMGAVTTVAGAGDKAGEVSSFFGTFGAVIIGVETLVAGVAGAIAGGKMRTKMQPAMATA